MYLIINLTRETITIDDLSLTIGPKKAIDLDKVGNASRSSIEKSKDLKKAEKKRKIRIRHSRPPQSQVAAPKEAVNIDDQINKMRDTVRKEIQDQLKSSQQPQPQQSNIDPNMLNALLSKMNEMIEGQKNTQYIPHQDIPKHTQDDADDIDVDKLAEIHAKAVGKQTKEAQGRISYENKKMKTDINKQADELDGLLG